MYHEAIIQRVHILQCDSLWQFMTDSLSKEKLCFGPFDHDKRLITNGHNSNQIHFYFYFIIIQNILKITKQSKSWPGIYDKFMGYINWRIKTSNKFLIFWTFDLLWPVPSTRLRRKQRENDFLKPHGTIRGQGSSLAVELPTSWCIMSISKFKPNGHDKQVIGRWRFHGIMLWTYYN